jgi:RNA polymerase sigma-70 factor (ECF subfamily)
MHSDDFERAVRQHQRRVFTLARYLLSSQDEAEDVAQEALVRLWRVGGTVTPAARQAWLLRVTRNLCYDQLRRRRCSRGAIGAVTEHDTAAVPSPSPDPELLAASSELGRRLLHELARLSEPHRSIVILREIEGLSCREIGDIVEMTEGSVRVALHRARRRLRDQLREVHHGSAPA